MKKRITEKGRDCSKCDTFKDWSEYNKTKATRTGYQSRCKLCCSKSGAKYIKRKPKGSAFYPEPGFSYKIQSFCLGFI
jgi:hypothetical protein